MLVTTRKKASAAAVRTPLSTQISRQLRARIVSGELALGAELPSESELTRELGVSRSTVREALRILQAQGLLAPTGAVSTRRPRVSTEELISHAAAQALENLVKLAELPLHDLVELRVVLEGAAVEAAARNQGASLAEARLALAQMQQRPLDADAFRAADLQFHRALLGAAGNAASCARRSAATSARRCSTRSIFRRR